MNTDRRPIIIFCLLMGFVLPFASAEDHFLYSRTINIRGAAISGVILVPANTPGDQSSVSDNRTGNLRIRLDDGVMPNSTISLAIFNPSSLWCKSRFVSKNC